MKLIIQIPCKNEQDTLPIVLSELPKQIDGIDVIEYQVIDDGSTDDTAKIAKNLGVHHIIRFKKNKGLGFAFKAGVENALMNGADILVNTDADNQYPGKYIKDLVAPIIAGQADITIGNRIPTQVKHFSLLKRTLQGVGNSVLSYITGEKLPDSVSGFRAYSKCALLELNVTSRFSYVIDTIIQAYQKGFKINWVPISINLPTRPSRLFKNIFQHIRKSTIDIIRVYSMYEPLKILLTASIPFILIGMIGVIRFLFDYMTGGGMGKIQSLIISGIMIQIGFTFLTLGVIGDLISKNRFLIEENLKISKQLKCEDFNSF